MTPSTIAAAMSEAQKRALMRGYASNWPNLNALLRMKLVLRADRFRFMHTPLGLAVRQHLQESAK